MGVIGMGRQAQYLIDGILTLAEVQLVAGCDVYKIKRDRFKKKVDTYYQAQNKKKRRRFI